MIDPIGNKPSIVPERRVVLQDASTPVTRIAAPAKAAPDSVAETSARVAAQSMASSAPVDRERVQQIKQAIAEGRFPITPAKIADRLIAAQLSWAALDEPN